MKRIFTLSLLAISLSAYSLSPVTIIQNHIHDHLQKGSGGMDGGGTGSLMRPESGAAWYYQDKKEGYISVCIKRSPKFKASKASIEKLILKSFNKWDRYISDQNIYEEENDDGTIDRDPIHTRILTKIKFETCTDKTNLTFYMGIQDKLVKKTLEGREHLKGFAFRKLDDVDSKEAYSKGFVWIFDPQDTMSPQDDHYYNWSKPELLEAILTHEVGHIMGNGHFNNTIMQEDLVGIFEWSQYSIDATTDHYSKVKILNSKKYLKEIDHERKLLSNPNPFQEHLKGKLGLSNSVELKKNFKNFMNREPHGEVKVKLSPGNQIDHVLKYIISDDASSKTFFINEMKVDTISADLENINWNLFKRHRVLKHNNGSSYFTSSQGRFVANLNARFIFKNIDPLFIMLRLNGGETQYFDPKDPDNINKVYSRSDVSLHYLDKNLKTQIMFVNEVGKHDFSNAKK